MSLITERYAGRLGCKYGWATATVSLVGLTLGLMLITTVW